MVESVVRPDAGFPGGGIGARRERGLLAIVLLVALALRVFGLAWGLPDRNDLNPDENTVLGLTAEMSWQNLDPGRYFYSGLTYQIFVIVRELVRLVRPGISDPALAVVYRSVTATLGTATVWVLFLLVRRLAPRGPAPLLGAAFLALMPLHVWDSHFATTDVGLTFWMLATVAASVWAYERPTWYRFALASALVGLAAGTKFNGAMAAPAIAIAGLLAVWERRVRLGQLFDWGCLGVGAAVAALFVASPFTFIKWRETLAAFQHELERVHDLDYGFNLWAAGWQYKPYVYQFAAAFPFSFGVALYAAVLGGLVYCAVRFHRVLLIPFGYAAVYLGIMGSWEFVPIRYYLPIDPVLLIAPALMLAAGLQARVPRVRWGAGGVLAVVIVYTAAFTISTTARFTDDTRIQAERWLEEHVAEGEKVLTVGATWYLPVPKRARGEVVNELRYGAMLDHIGAGSPDYVVLTSLHYARSYRQQDDNVRMWDTVRRGGVPYRLAQRFRAEYLNWRLYRKLDPMYEGYFISPTIEIYRRQ